MHGAVERLVRLIPPPPPVTTFPPWEDAQSEIGFSFPVDYRDFVDVYGKGSIDDEFFLIAPSLRPAEPGRSVGFAGFIENTTGGLGRSVAEMRENAVALDDEQAFPYPIYPEDGGLILFALNSNGDLCFWDSRMVNPDEWTVVIYRQAVRIWVPFDGCMAEMLLSAVEGRLPEAPSLLGFNEDGFEWTRKYAWAG